MRTTHGLGDLAHRMLHPHDEARRRMESQQSTTQQKSDEQWVGMARPALSSWTYKLALVPHSAAHEAEVAATARVIRHRLSGRQLIIMAGVYTADGSEAIEEGLAAHSRALGCKLAAESLGLCAVSRDVILHEEPKGVSPMSLVELAPKLSGISSGVDDKRSPFGIVMVERTDLPALGISSIASRALLFGGVKHGTGQLSWLPLE